MHDSVNIYLSSFTLLPVSTHVVFQLATVPDIVNLLVILNIVKYQQVSAVWLRQKLSCPWFFARLPADTCLHLDGTLCVRMLLKSTRRARYRRLCGRVHLQKKPGVKFQISLNAFEHLVCFLNRVYYYHGIVFMLRTRQRSINN